ncbi:5-hydroxytryptamine receptor 3A-like [Mercenaria mercenaria]|uniref:5-hydroxytryptamine receptor 3A-like n=1 Tax=Mercenaria mercenaria TaxID=6596 RepID=UPI00234ECF09|nr:5-hydroxytryptamine receptor 3A-like [Mercenaria mercenaria]
MQADCLLSKPDISDDNYLSTVYQWNDQQSSQPNRTHGENVPIQSQLLSKKGTWIRITFYVMKSMTSNCQSGHLSTTKCEEFVDMLFDGYSKNMLPVLKTQDALLLNLSLYHMSIDHLDIKHKIASARIIFGVAWIDEYLRWNPSELRNTSKLSIEAKSIWLPDLFIGNKENLLTFIKPENVQKVILHNSGLVEAWPYLNVEVGVDLDIHKYPFDTQVCEFEFSSWLNNDRELDILDIQEAVESNDSLQQFSGERISLTLAVFFSIVNNSLPQTSDGVPVIVAYIGLQMIGSALILLSLRSVV